MVVDHQISGYHTVLYRVLTFHAVFSPVCKGDVTIPSNIFTVDSELNGDSPQFTFTCTSTGGPVTTVTWTRDFETVLGGMTVLDSAVTAQYTHTLTVTGRLGGQYQCNVTNNKPSTAAAQFTIQGYFII